MLGMPSLAQMGGQWAQFAQMVASFMLQAQQTPPTQPPPIVHHAPQTEPRGSGGSTSRVDLGLSEFRKLDPPRFQGSGDPAESLLWLEEVEKAFESMNYTGSERVRFASYQLQGEAYCWWKTIRRLGSVD